MEGLFLGASLLHLFGLMAEKDKNKKKMRIIDILKRDDNDEHDDFIGGVTKKNRRVEGSNSVLCSSVRSIITRWISPLKRSRDLSSSSLEQRGFITLSSEENNTEDCLRKMEKGGDSVNEDLLVGFDARDVNDRSIVKSEEFISHTEISPSPGRYMKNASFSLGLGAGLVYLMVATRNEFHKMTELQSQIESLLKDVNGGVQRKNVNCKPSESSNVLGFSTTDSPSVEDTNNNTNNQNCTSSHHLVKTKVDVKGDEHLECLQSKKECVVGIDELEAEFEAELERLQLSLDTEDSLVHPRQQEQEMVDENSAPTWSHCSSFEVMDNPEETDSMEQSGVSPHELKSRLHELVETRQRERIEELESALECIKQELHQKEMELSWWKDTARSSSQHVSEVSPLSR